jgi:endonuclease/exonuclease/phosphatase family metal-dependent hydrolase
MRGLMRTVCILLLILCALAACVSSPVLLGGAPPAPCGAPSEQAIRWMRALGARERVASNQWCEGVGNPVVLEAPRAASAATLPLTIISWNTHVGGGDVARLLDDARAGRLTGTHTESIVLLLQEVYRQGGSVPPSPPAAARFASGEAPAPPHALRQGIVATAQASGLSLVYVPSMRNGVVAEDRGNAILSSVALDDIEAVELPLERQRRVAIAAEIAIRTHTPVTLRIVSAHLTNMVPHHLWALSETGRIRQARTLAAALKDDVPTVLGGDLNSWFGYRDGAFRELARVLPLARPGDRRPTFGPMRLDHVLARLPPGWHISVRRANSRYGSDHYPLVAIIE